MPTVVGVAFKKAGKVYNFGTNGLELREGMNVIAHTKRGWKMGMVVTNPKEITEEEIIGDFCEVDRIATRADMEKVKRHPAIAAEHFKVCEQKIAEHGLPMRLLSAELSFDESMITFFFAAENRVDFRELVRDVAGAIHLKVQLMQIGVRDEAKLIGGYGSCGRQLCCSLFMSDLSVSVSMKMAKDQSLFLNPAKFSGCCGKLMCCLKFENEFYSQMQSALPAVGVYLNTDKGVCKVKEYNYIAGTAILVGEEGSSFTVPLAKLNMEGLCRKHGIHTENCDENCQTVDVERLRELGVMTLKKDEEETPFTIPSYDGSTSISFDFPEEEPESEGKASKKKHRRRQSASKNGNNQKMPKGPKPFTMGGDDSPDLGIVFRDLKDEANQAKKKKKHRPSKKNKPGAPGSPEQKDTANE
ncbi:MAG: hypothetical protein IK083_03335 [Abditibacteriota bacterium]|nr:hypothetical protein [Abditibacteriota bacterium]